MKILVDLQNVLLTCHNILSFPQNFDGTANSPEAMNNLSRFRLLFGQRIIHHSDAMLMLLDC